EGYTHYQNRIRSAEGQDNFRDAVNNTELKNDNHWSGATLKDYHYWWVVSPDLVFSIVRYDLSEFKGILKTRSRSTRGGPPLVLWFSRGGSDTHSITLLPPDYSIDKPTAIDAYKLSLYCERVRSGNFLWMNIAKAD